MSCTAISQNRTTFQSRSEPKRKTVLCIDDDQMITSSLSTFLKAKNFEVHCAQSHHQGITQLTHFKPDVILTDLAMPDGNGEMIVEVVKSNPALQHLPILILTGIQDNSVERRLEMLGVDKIIRKPYPIRKVVAEIVRFSDQQSGGTGRTHNELPGATERTYFTDRSHNRFVPRPKMLSRFQR